MATSLFPELKARKFDRIFICRKCGARIRADPNKVRAGLVRCRKCKSKALRPKKSEIVLVASKTTK
ncbi:MAG: 50S ribosomal protein L40e [Nanopusillaceae archaeon]